MENIKILLPLTDIIESAAVLSDIDLKEQRFNTRRTLRFLNGKADLLHADKVRTMWDGYEDFLKYYYNVCIVFLKQRGYAVGSALRAPSDLTDVKLPFWWGDNVIHRSHRSILIENDYTYYSQYKWHNMGLDYSWPIKEEAIQDDLSDSA